MTTPTDRAGKETRTVHDPFLKQDVEISNKLTDRLRGKYASGPIMPNGEPEFGWRQFETPPIQHEAATALDALQARVKELEEEERQSFQRYVDANEARIEAEPRTTRAEQERDEDRRDAERYRFLRGRDLDTIHKGGVFAGMTPQNIILNEGDLDREVDAAIRRLASGPDKEK